jgi:hypothetical protein
MSQPVPERISDVGDHWFHWLIKMFPVVNAERVGIDKPETFHPGR